MSIPHLSDDELNLAVLGDELPPETAKHLAGCLACVRRRDAFLTTVEMARGTDPDDATRALVRERALAAWGAPNHHWVRWLAAAAAVLVLSLLPLRLNRTAPRLAVNADAVMTEVEQILERDPLSAVAAEEVVDAVVPVSAESGERSVS